MSLFVPKKNTCQDARAMKNGELVEKPRTVSTSKFKPIAKPGKPAAEPRVSIQDRMASTSMEPMDTKSDKWEKPVDLSAIRKEIKTPTIQLPELKETHTRKTYTLPKYTPSTQAKEIGDLLESLSIAETIKEESGEEYAVKGLEVPLMPHQVAGLKFLREREKNLAASGGFLCDDMGLGKTVQSIALILKNKPKKEYAGTKTTLVAVPLAVMDQWAEEIKQKAPTLSVKTHQGPKRTTDPEELRKYKVVVATYDTIVAEYKQLEKKPPLFESTWYRIIADEAHIFRNPKSVLSSAMNKLKSKGKRWALTGTPINNSIGDLFSLVKFIGIEPFNDHAYWKSKVMIAPDGNTKVKKMLQACMLRRQQKVIKLPECTRKIHEFNLKAEEGKTLEEVINVMRSSSNEEALLTLLSRCRQICNDTVLFRETDSYKKARDLFKSRSARSAPSSTSKDRPEPEHESETNSDTEDLAALLGGATISEKSDASSKTLEIVKILNTDPKRKTVIFSFFVQMLERIAEQLRKEGISYRIYEGSLSAEARRHVLHDFRSNKDTTVLLCSLSCAAVGINITAASRVIMAEPWWNPMLVDQAVNRVHRIGQEQPVDVYEMMAIGTLEERIFDLQDRKRVLATNMLEENKKLTPAEMRYVLYGEAKS